MLIENLICAEKGWLLTVSVDEKKNASAAPEYLLVVKADKKGCRLLARTVKGHLRVFESGGFVSTTCRYRDELLKTLYKKKKVIIKLQRKHAPFTPRIDRRLLQTMHRVQRRVIMISSLNVHLHVMFGLVTLPR